MTVLTADADIGGDTDLLGKSVTDLQADIEVGDDEITGTLKHVTGYTGFSGDPAEQEGNYLALHFASEEGATITVELVGGTSGPKVLDADGLAIFRISDKTTQTIKVTAEAEGRTAAELDFGLTGLTLLEE